MDRRTGTYILVVPPAWVAQEVSTVVDKQKIWIAGLVGTALFALILDILPTGGEPINIALWDGSFVTLNLTIAVIIGYVLEFLIGVGLAFLYHKYWGLDRERPAMRGLLFGVGTWAVFMIIGMPIFDAVSPLVQHGFLLGPGLFLWRIGIMAPISWLIASAAYGTAVGYMMERPLPAFHR